MPLRRASIRSRLTAIIMAASTISVLLTTIIISIIGVYNLKVGMMDELSLSASIVGDRNTAALLFNDDKLAESNMRVFSARSSILQACLYDKDGHVFASYGNEQENITPHCPGDLHERTVMGEQALEVMKPIVKMGERIGTIYIESDLHEIAAYIQKQTYIAVVVTLAVLFVSYLLAVVLQQGISKPVLSLAATAREISLNKDYSIRANPFGNRSAPDNNEIKVLTDSFNAMLQEIGERDSRLRQQNIELERARDAAEAANRAKSQFLANISHELRTPLNAIIGFSSILMNQLFGPLGDAKYMEYSKDINESGSHLLDIINDILDLAKAEAGKLTLNLEEVHVGKAIAKCVTILSDRATKGKVVIALDVPRNLPSLMADRLRFIQIVLNILSNAVKFTEEGGKVHIRASLREGTHQMAIVISDTGIGMAKEDVDKAFQSFGQVDSGLNRKYEGTGLGLPLTKKLMELHGGGISIDSEPGVGTRVTLMFPLTQPEAPEAL